MIDLMALRQSYEEREIDEIRWIAGGDNPADAMTKRSPNQALEELVSTNTTTIKMEGWVKRGKKKECEGDNELQFKGGQHLGAEKLSAGHQDATHVPKHQEHYHHLAPEGTCSSLVTDNQRAAEQQPGRLPCAPQASS